MTDTKEKDCLNNAMSEQILMYYNRYLNDNGFITDKEYFQMNTRITAYYNKKSPPI